LKRLKLKASAQQKRLRVATGRRTEQQPKGQIMKNAKAASIPLITIILAFCFGFDACDKAHKTSGTSVPASTASPASSPAQTAGGDAGQGNNTSQQTRPEIEQQRKEMEQQAEQTVDKEAVAAIAETRNALKAIAANKTDEALKAIERATGKVSILLARNPAAALIPVAYDVEVIDAAPLDIPTIRDRARAAAIAFDAKDYPTARILLYGLTSETRSRTYNLPLATYPDALKEAAGLLDQKKNEEAATTLLTALSALVVIDRIRPLPLVLAQIDIDEAQAARDKDKSQAQKLLADARNQLDRARELGYAGNDPEYAALNKIIADLQAQMKGNQDTASGFSRLKDEVAAFLKKISDSVRRV
jgi:hypothetical protein